MPELPDIEVYRACLRRRIVGQTLERIRVVSPFLVRSIEPPLSEAEGRTVRDVRRLGKRIVISLADDLFLVFHLMIAGRFGWKRGPLVRESLLAPPPKLGKIGLAAFDFPSGTLVLTEAGTKKRASLHLVRGQRELAVHDPGGIEVLGGDMASFRAALLRENHTLKRALTDPRLFAGIGNAYSDEILHAARLSPVMLSGRLGEPEIARLHAAVQATLSHWTEVLLKQFAERFPGPGNITAFREGFAVHGRFGKPCPVCGSPVQRIRYADNETNYCARCQTGGRVLADRSLSRLLREDWPRTIEEWDAR